MSKRPIDPPDSQHPPAAVPTPPPPFSRPFVVDRLRHAEEVEITVEANAQERAGLAQRDGLVGVDRLAGRFRVMREGATGVRVVGGIEADVVQTCGVTLDPFPAAVREAVDVHFVPEVESAAAAAAAMRAGIDGEIDLADAADPPDPIVDGRIDLGALAAEFLTLGLDPYPRKPGATFAAAPAETSGEAGSESPFAVLERLRDRKS